MPYEKTLVKQLENDLQTSVVNLGQIAYGFKQELEVLKRFALPLSPKVVVWALFGGNDLRDIPMYETMLAEYGQPPAPVPLEERLFLRNLMVFISRAADQALRSEPSERALNHSGMFRRADSSRERVYFGQTNEPVEDEQWRVTTETLDEARRLSQAAGAHFVVLYIPRKFRTYRDHLELAPDTEIAGWDVNDLPTRLKRWCAANSIGFIDTTPLLINRIAAGIHPYFIDDVHWNPLGHRLAADAIIDYLKGNGLYPFPATGSSADPAG